MTAPDAPHVPSAAGSAGTAGAGFRVPAPRGPHPREVLDPDEPGRRVVRRDRATRTTENEENER